MKFLLQGYEVALAVSRRPLTSETRVRYLICSGHSGTRSSFYPNTSVFTCQYHFVNGPYSVLVLILLLLDAEAGET